MTNEEVLALSKVLIKDNEKITSIEMELGTFGAGNTNTSGFSSDRKWKLELSEINGAYFDFFSTSYNGGSGYCYNIDNNSYAVYAVVNDVIYLVKRSNYNGAKTVIEIPYNDEYYVHNSVAYDTYGSFSVRPDSFVP